MKMRYLRDNKGKIDKRYMIAEDGSYVRDKRIGEKLNEASGNVYILKGYLVISITINGEYCHHIKICQLQWLAWKGIIPKGFVVHHKKWNKDKKANKRLKLNDHIGNLDCMSKSKHMKIHGSGENSNFYGKCLFGKNNPNFGKGLFGEKNPMFGKFGEKSSYFVLNEKQVNEIRAIRYINNWKMKDIAKKFDVSMGAINSIIQGYTWNPDNLTKDELINLFMKGFKNELF